jgi:hypothetical protein
MVKRTASRLNPELNEKAERPWQYKFNCKNTCRVAVTMIRTKGIIRRLAHPGMAAALQAEYAGGANLRHQNQMLHVLTL